MPHTTLFGLRYHSASAIMHDNHISGVLQSAPSKVLTLSPVLHSTRKHSSTHRPTRSCSRSGRSGSHTCRGRSTLERGWRWDSRFPRQPQRCPRRKARMRGVHPGLSHRPWATRSQSAAGRSDWSDGAYANGAPQR
jgi:hypothetical protein